MDAATDDTLMVAIASTATDAILGVLAIDNGQRGSEPRTGMRRAGCDDRRGPLGQGTRRVLERNRSPSRAVLGRPAAPLREVIMRYPIGSLTSHSAGYVARVGAFQLVIIDRFCRARRPIMDSGLKGA